jgi:hypothetical protein
MKTRVFKFAVFCLLAFFLILLATQAQENAAQKKTMARRAAITDAQRVLSEIISGIHITGETSIRDFITTNDTIKTNLEGFVRGATISKEDYADKIYRVTLSIDVQKLKAIIGKEFEYDSPYVEAVGSGTTGEKKPRSEAPEKNAQKEWYEQVLQIKGYGAPPNNPTLNKAQKKLDAERSAKMDAYRNIIEQIKGTHVDSKTTVQDFIVQDDSIMTNIQAFVRGARVIKSVLLPDGRHEVTLEISLEPLKAIIK